MGFESKFPLASRTRVHHQMVLDTIKKGINKAELN